MDRDTNQDLQRWFQYEHCRSRYSRNTVLSAAGYVFLFFLLNNRFDYLTNHQAIAVHALLFGFVAILLIGIRISDRLLGKNFLGMHRPRKYRVD